MFGESAGGASVLTLMTTPAARGLFARAIVESGGGWAPVRRLGEQEQAGVALTKAAAGLGPDASVEALRAIPADKLFDIPLTLSGVSPFVDGRLIKANIPRVFAAGEAVPVPLIVGSNSYEASLMTAFKIPPQRFLALLPAADRPLYPKGDETAAAALFTDSIMGAPARWLAGQASKQAPAYLYHFSYVPTLQRRNLPGAGNGEEVIFVFGAWSGVVDQFASAEDRAMELKVHACWVAFAKTGTPACGQAWPAYTPGADTLMEFGVQTGPVAHFREAQYRALEQLQLPAVLSPK